MQIEYDPDKNTANFTKHSVSLSFGVRVFDDVYVAIIPTVRETDGEERLKAVGLVDDRLYTAVHVWRGEVVRFVSVRRSNDGEGRLYHRLRSRSERS